MALPLRNYCRGDLPALAGIVALLIVGFGVATGAAQSPEVESFRPGGLQRGAEVELRFDGERLDTFRQIIFLRPGLRLGSFESTDGRKAVARISAAADCPAGEHPFWLIGSGGISRLLTLHVERFPVVAEAEDNSSVAAAQPLDPSAELKGITVVGEIEGADVDCFRWRLSAGERLSVEVEAMRFGQGFFDAAIDVVDPAGDVIVSSDDTALLRHDPLLSTIAPISGEYVVRIRDAAFDGEPGARYRMHIGSFARPTVAMPAGGRPGEQLVLQLLGDPTGPIAMGVKLPDVEDGYHHVAPTGGPGGAAPSPVRLRVVDLPNTLEREPNNDATLATPCGAEAFAANGVLGNPGDVDYFSFDAKLGDRLALDLFGSRLGSPIDSMLTVHSAAGVRLAENDDAAVHDSHVDFVVPYDGRFYLRVEDHLARGGSEFTYRVEVRERPPALEVSLPAISSKREREGGIAVPRGGRTALLVAVRRVAVGGKVEVMLEGLPVGVKAPTEIIPFGDHLALVVLEAEPGATPSASLARVKARALDASAEASLQQQVSIVHGEPRQTAYHSVEVDRVPVVVTDAAPFSIEVRQPDLPLSADGWLGLQVEIRRKPGFSGEVEISAPLLPRWIERSESAVAAAGDVSSVVFPLTATDRAGVAEHPFVLVGTAIINDAPVRVASNRVEVRLRQPLAEVDIAQTPVEQGRRAEVPCRVDWLSKPEGDLVARLRGLPKHASAEPERVTAGDTRVTFNVKVGLETPPAVHNTLYVEFERDRPGAVRSLSFAGRGGAIEVFPRGGSAGEKLSPLEALRRQASQTQGRSAAWAASPKPPTTNMSEGLSR